MNFNYMPEFLEISKTPPPSSTKEDLELTSDEQLSCFDATISFPEIEGDKNPPFRKRIKSFKKKA